MNHLFDHLSRILDFLAVLVPAWIVVRKWFKRLEMSMGFSRDVALTHLPHIYKRLRRLDDKAQLPVEEHPDIVYLNGNGHSNGMSQTSGPVQPS